MLDAYNSWRHVASAMPYVSMYCQYDPFWIENPFMPEEPRSYAEIAAAISVPIATGEFHYGRWVFRSIVESGAATILQAEAPRCGGITEWLEIANIASAAGADMSPCWFHDLHAHLVASTSNGLMVEVFTNQQILNFGKLIDQPLSIERGRIVLPRELGVGFSVQPEAVRKWKIH